MEKYELQKLILDDKEKFLKVWQNTGIFSDDLKTLKIVCPIGFRIVEKKTGNVVYDPEQESLL